MARGAQSLCRPPLLLCHIAGREPIDPKKTETVTYEQLAEHINYCSTYKAENNIIIVDVRPPEEIRKYGGMIPTAHNVPCKAQT